jgi:hypothetical protein
MKLTVLNYCKTEYIKATQPACNIHYTDAYKPPCNNAYRGAPPTVLILLMYTQNLI